MDRLILWALPKLVRDRYGDEVRELLLESARPIRDGADIALAGIGMRLGRAMPLLFVVTIVALGGSAVGLVHAVANLRDGVVEIPDHWWSTFIAASFVVSALTVVGLTLAQRRAAAWR